MSGFDPAKPGPVKCACMNCGHQCPDTKDDRIKLHRQEWSCDRGAFKNSGRQVGLERFSTSMDHRTLSRGNWLAWRAASLIPQSLRVHSSSCRCKCEQRGPNQPVQTSSLWHGGCGSKRRHQHSDWRRLDKAQILALTGAAARKFRQQWKGRKKWEGREQEQEGDGHHVGTGSSCRLTIDHCRTCLAKTRSS